MPPLETINKPLAREDFEKAALTLEGLIQGITSDDMINQKELDALNSWKKKHFFLIRNHPFDQLTSMIDSVLGCCILTAEEKENILAFCREFRSRGEYFDRVASELYRMNGFLRGILADEKLYRKEVESLRDWLLERPDLKGYYPYDPLLEHLEAFLSEACHDAECTEELYRYLTELSNFLTQ